MMTEEDILDLYKSLITEVLAVKKAGVSFVEIEEWLEREDIPYDGDYYLEHPDYDNVMIWAGNEKFIDSVMELLDGGEIHLRPTAAFTYVLDGKVPDKEVAKLPPKDGYKEVRWVPYAVYLGDGMDS